MASVQRRNHLVALAAQRSVAPGNVEGDVVGDGTVAGRFGPEEARMRIEQGWQFIAVGSELKLLLDASKKATDAIGLGKGSSEMAKY